MKAVFIEEQGGLDVLKYGERPDPIVGPGEVKVRVRASALNRLDLYTRMGVRGIKLDLSGGPRILGSDSAGDIVEIGPALHENPNEYPLTANPKVSNVKDLKIGQRVVVQPHITCGQCISCSGGKDQLCPNRDLLGIKRDGTYAEYIVVPVANVHPLPDHLSYEEAAALPAVYLITWNLLLRRAKLQPWETCLVLSASGGLGSAAVIVAKNVIGARCIATTSSPEKVKLVEQLGADEVINYAEEDFFQRTMELTDGRGVDVIVDHTGKDTFDKCMDLLADWGRYGICGVTTGYRGQIHLGKLFTREHTVIGVDNGSKEDMRQIVNMASKGTIKGIVDRTFSLKDVADAHKYLEGSDHFGKVIIKIP